MNLRWESWQVGRVLETFGCMAIAGMVTMSFAAGDLMPTGDQSAVVKSGAVWRFYDNDGADLWVDREGRRTTPPVAEPGAAKPQGFAEARPYADGFSAVKLGGECGFVNKNGMLLPARFKTCGDFHEGVAKVVTGDGMATYVHADLTPFHPGMPASEDSPGLWFRDGLAPMQDSSSKLWGYIDTQGRWAIVPRFQVAGSFSEGMARVEALDQHDRLRLGFINRTGKLVIGYKFGPQSASGHWIQFAEGRAIVADAGRFKVAGQLDDMAETPNRAWYGVIDMKGHWISPLRFQSCGDCVFRDGRAQVLDPGQKLIDRDGRVIWSAK